MEHVMWIIEWLPDALIYGVTFLSALALIISTFFKELPFVGQYAKAIQLGSVVVLIFGIYLSGGISNEAKWQARVDEMKLEMAKKETASAEASTKVVTKYLTVDRIVKEKGDAIIKEIPKYISQNADAQCAVPNGFVVLHDSASRNEVPNSTRSADEGTSKVKISGVAEVVVENYTTCNQTAEQLRSLQEWIKEQQAIYNK